MATTDDIFGEVIFAYTRAEALADGTLVDVTEWASADKGFIGGFKCPVAVTRAVWDDIEYLGEGFDDVRGRAHDVLWMASLAARRGGSETLFDVLLQVRRTRKQTYKLVAGPDDDGSLCITIMKPDES